MLNFCFGRTLASGMLVCTLSAALTLTSITAHAHNPHDPVLAFAMSPNFNQDQTLFAATYSELNWGYKQIFRSIDAGDTWSKLPNGMDNRFDFSGIAVSPAYVDDSTVFAATRGDGIFQSTDEGDSWRRFNTGLAGMNVKELRVGGSRSSSYTVFASTTGGGLFRRTASDTRWNRVLEKTVNVSVTAVSPDYAQDGTVLVATDTGHLLRTTDRGDTWRDLGALAGSVVYDVAIAPGRAQEIFVAAAGGGVLYSNNGGATFVRKQNGLPTVTINNVAVSPNYRNDRAVFCTSVGETVYKSSNGGNSWKFYPTGAKITGQTNPINEFSELQISRTYAKDGAVFMTAFDGLFRSMDGGVTWTEAQTRMDIATGVALSPNFRSDRRIIATSYSGGGLYKSEDSGGKWTRAVTGWTQSQTAPLSFFDVEFVANRTGRPLAVAIQNFSSIGFSSDLGASWKVLPIAEMPSVAAGRVYPTVIGVSPAFDIDGEIYLGTRKHGLIQSRDGGKSWQPVSDVPTTALITSVVVSPNYAADGTAFAATLNGEVWRTVNGGSNWLRVGASSIVLQSGTKFNKFTWLAISPNFAADRMVLAGTNNGIFRSNDGGRTWQSMGLSDIGRGTVVEQIEFSPNFVTDRAAFVTIRGQGMMRLTLDRTGEALSAVNIGTRLLGANIEFTEFRLSPNYSSDGTLMGVSDANVYRSSDRGDTWRFLGMLGNR